MQESMDKYWIAKKSMVKTEHGNWGSGWRTTWANDSGTLRETMNH